MRLYMLLSTEMNNLNLGILDTLIIIAFYIYYIYDENAVADTYLISFYRSGRIYVEIYSITRYNAIANDIGQQL